MNHEERQVITDIFDRLRQVENQPRDPEAERFIADKLRLQPYAPYAMAQAIYIQEQALANLNAEVEHLRAEVEHLRRQPQGGGGFLASIFGGGSRQQEPRPQYGSSSGSPWGRTGGSLPGYGAPQGGYSGYGGPQGGPMGGAGPWGGGMGGGMQPRAGGGFLQSALTTAAGVAGGMMIGNALSNAFGSHEPGGHNALSSAGGHGGEPAGGNDTGGITDSLYQNASQEEPDLGDDPGSDFGGGDDGDWA
jgi:hypothetical protein